MAADESDRERGKSLQTIERAFEIIEFLENRGGAGVTEVANEFDIPKSTAHSYLHSLEKTEYATNEEATYRPSLKLLERGGAARHRLKVYHRAKAEINALSRTEGELTNLGVEQHGQRVLLYNSEADEAVTDRTPIGEHTYMHWSALGKAILAYYPEERIQSIVDRHGLPKATEYAIGTEEELYEEMELIREQGYALEDEERHRGMRAVAVPILDNDEFPIASISISGPKNRFNDDRIADELLEELLNTANIIELKYSHY